MFNYQTVTMVNDGFSGTIRITKNTHVIIIVEFVRTPNGFMIYIKDYNMDKRFRIDYIEFIIKNLYKRSLKHEKLVHYFTNDFECELHCSVGGKYNGTL